MTRSGSWSGVESIPPRWQIYRFILRMLDSQRAELRVCAMQDDASTSHPLESAEPGTCLSPALAGRPSTRVTRCEPQTWTAVVPLDALPAQTREVLRVARDFYETDELDLSASDELNRLLLGLRATTWTPDPRTTSLH